MFERRFAAKRVQAVRGSLTSGPTRATPNVSVLLLVSRCIAGGRMRKTISFAPIFEAQALLDFASSIDVAQLSHETITGRTARPVISPNGQHVAYVALDDNRTKFRPYLLNPSSLLLRSRRVIDPNLLFDPLRILLVGIFSRFC